MWDVPWRLRTAWCGRNYGVVYGSPCGRPEMVCLFILPWLPLIHIVVANNKNKKQNGLLDFNHPLNPVLWGVYLLEIYRFIFQGFWISITYTLSTRSTSPTCIICTGCKSIIVSISLFHQSILDVKNCHK